MKLSIVTVCFNSIETIERTIQSVLEQNDCEIEYLVIDGGSTDGTVSIIKKYSDKIAFWCSEADNGIYDAMNKGILKSSGDIIAFLNSGDIYEQGSLHVVSEYFAEMDTDILYCDYTQIWGEGKKIIRRLNHIDLDMLYYTMPFCHQAMFFKKSLFSSVGLYDTRFDIAADYKWALEAYIKKAKYHYLPTNICYYDTSGLSSNMAKTVREFKEISMEIAEKNGKKEFVCRIEQQYQNLNLSQYNKIYRAILNDDILVISQAKKVLANLGKIVLMFGAGGLGQQFIWLAEKLEIKILTIMDNNKNIWNTSVESINVIKPQLLMDDSCKIVIAVLNNIDEIESQLIQLGYAKNNIITYNQIKRILEEQITMEA